MGHPYQDPPFKDTLEYILKSTTKYGGDKAAFFVVDITSIASRYSLSNAMYIDNIYPSQPILIRYKQPITSSTRMWNLRPLLNTLTSHQEQLQPDARRKSRHMRNLRFGSSAEMNRGDSSSLRVSQFE